MFKFFKNIEITDGCWLWKGPLDTHGYGQFYDEGKQKLSHRYSFLIFNGSIGKGKMILHRCDVRNCVNPKHLYEGTQKDNMRDMVSRGRNADARGEKNPRAKLSACDVREIRASELTHRELASKYGVSKSTIDQISRNAIWRSIVNA